MALALVTALLSPAAHPPPPPRLELVLTLPHSGDGPVAIGGDSVYGVAPTATGMALTAYRLADGTPRWTVPVPASGQTPWLQVAAGVPIVTGLDPTRPGELDLRMGAFDPDTGRLLWSRTGSVQGAGVVGSRWVGVQRTIFDAGDPSNLPAMEFAAVDVRTGRPLWTFRTPRGVTAALEGDWPGRGSRLARYAVTLAPGGLLTRHDLATGAELARARARAVRPDEARLLLAGELVLLWYGSGERRRLAVHDVTTLAHRWTGAGVDIGGGLADCGPVVCLVHGGPAPRMSGVDPVTGRVRWSAPCGGAATPDGRCDMEVQPLGPSLVAVQDEPLSPARRRPPARVLDAATGAPAANLHGWFPLWPSSGPDPVLQRVLREPAPPGRPEGRFSFGRLHAGTPGVRTLGAIEAEWCQAHDEHLLCATTGAGWQVWRIR